MTQNGAVCLPGPALLFFIFRFEDLISGARFSKVPVTLRARNQKFKSKYKE